MFATKNAALWRGFRGLRLNPERLILTHEDEFDSYDNRSHDRSGRDHGNHPRCHSL
jgi:hypothetical protein